MIFGRSSAKHAVAPLTASKAMAKKPGGSEVRLQSAERAAASPMEGQFRVLPEGSVVDAFLTMSPDRVLNKQVRDFIRNGENASALQVLNQIVANSRLGRTRRDSDVSRTPSQRSVRTLGTRDSRETKIETEGGTMFEIVVVMIRSIESEIKGEMIAGDLRGIVTGTVRGADVTGGVVTIADRLSHGDCGR